MAEQDSTPQPNDMNDLIAQAAQVQAELQKAQEEILATNVEGSAGNGLVKVTMTGGAELVVKDPRLAWFVGMWRSAAIRCQATPSFQRTTASASANGTPLAAAWRARAVAAASAIAMAAIMAPGSARSWPAPSPSPPCPS